MDTRVIEILRRSEWAESDIVKNGDIMTCQIDGEILEAAVMIHPKEISAKLLKDGIELTASANLMLMAPIIYTTDLYSGIANDNCVMRLKQLIIGLYHDYKTILNNLEVIRSLLPKYLNAKDEWKSSVASINMRKGELKKMFKEGELSQKAYIARRRVMNSISFQQYCSLKSSFDEIFGHMLSECTHCNNLMETIENLMRLRPENDLL